MNNLSRMVRLSADGWTSISFGVFASPVLHRSGLARGPMGSWAFAAQAGSNGEKIQDGIWAPLGKGINAEQVKHNCTLYSPQEFSVIIDEAQYLRSSGSPNKIQPGRGFHLLEQHTFSCRQVTMSAKALKDPVQPASALWWHCESHSFPLCTPNNEFPTLTTREPVRFSAVTPQFD